MGKRKLSTADFIRRARRIHKNRYDYSKTVYGQNGRSKVTVICPVHGSFSQKAESHLNGHGCIECGREQTHRKSRGQKQKKFLSFQELTAIVRSLGIMSQLEYRKAYKQIGRAPSLPFRTYKNQWKGWRTFLGTAPRQTRLASTGRICPSIAHATIETALHGMFGNTFQSEVEYGNGAFIADWKLSDGTLVEYFGFDSGGRSKIRLAYQKKMRRKKAYCRRHDIRLISIRLSDLDRLREIFESQIEEQTRVSRLDRGFRKLAATKQISGDYSTVRKLRLLIEAEQEMGRN